MDEIIFLKIEEITLQERDKILQKATPKLRKLLEVIPVLVKVGDGSLYGDYCGTPYPDQRSSSPYTYPSDIKIYASAYKYIASSGPKLRKKIRMVLIHEYGHYLGLSENELREKGIY